MFSKQVHLLLEVTEDDTLRFRDCAARSFSLTRARGAVAAGRADRDQYELSAKPSFDVPEFLLKRLLKRDARQMIDRLRHESRRVPKPV